MMYKNYTQPDEWESYTKQINSTDSNTPKNVYYSLWSATYRYFN